MNFHTLKIWPPFLTEIRTNAKRAELRLDDRDYDVGDVLVLQEYLPGQDELEAAFAPREGEDDGDRETRERAQEDVRLAIQELVMDADEPAGRPTLPRRARVGGPLFRGPQGGYTGESEIVQVTHVLRGFPGLQPGYCLLSFERRVLAYADPDEDGPGPN